jgi:hypothetical protein
MMISSEPTGTRQERPFDILGTRRARTRK